MGLCIICTHPDQPTLVWDGRKWGEWAHRNYTHRQHAELAVEKMRNGPLLQGLLAQGYEPVITTTKELRLLLRTEHELREAALQRYWVAVSMKNGLDTYPYGGRA